MLNNNKVISYFAAANGYSGFRSYFEYVFNRNKHTRLFILKGGPGTGKSTLMKGIAEEFKSISDRTELVYCSSDKSSLDGVIIYKNGLSVALLDGTAPHEEDAKIPGAVDEIINLGGFWNTDILRNSVDDIKLLDNKKKSNYKTAYEILSIAGEFDKCIREIVNNAYGDDYETIYNIISGISDINHSRNDIIMLESCFGKDGFVHEFDLGSTEKTIQLKGIFGSEYIFMSHLLSYPQIKKMSKILVPNPLSENTYDSVILNELCISVNKASPEEIDTSRFIDWDQLNRNLDRINFYKDTKNELLNKAKHHFSIASKMHFMLEEIYTKAMDFDKLNKYKQNLIYDIKNTLCFK